MNTRHDEDYNFLFKSMCPIWARKFWWSCPLKHCFNIVILVGDTGVGKTHLLSRYIKGSLPKNKFPTIGVEFATKPVPLKTGGTVKAQIWDTGKLPSPFFQADLNTLLYSWTRKVQSHHKRVSSLNLLTLLSRHLFSIIFLIIQVS